MLLPIELRQRAAKIKDEKLRQAFCAGAIAYAEYVGGSPDVNAMTEQRTEVAEVLPSLFDEFWNLYDKKVGKTKAANLWFRLTSKEKHACLDYVPKYKAAQPDKQYRKNPETFLRNKCWNDELIYSTNARINYNNSAGQAAANGIAATNEQECKYIKDSTANLFAGVD